MFNFTDLTLAFRLNYNFWRNYQNEMKPVFSALQYMQREEVLRMLRGDFCPASHLEFNLLASNFFLKGLRGGLKSLHIGGEKIQKSLLESLFPQNGNSSIEEMRDFINSLLSFVEFDNQVLSIQDQFGLCYGRHLELVNETAQFYLFRVVPTQKIKKKRQKPVLIVPPYVLGHDILGFLPDEGKSFVHAFANKGVPTYIRILKDISENIAVQEMTLEDDIADTALFCKLIARKHRRAVTLNGYCQGGYFTLLSVLSGKVAGIVDTLITCVAPMDGTRGGGVGGFLSDLPERFRDVRYSLKKLPNGNLVVDGDVMSFIYKLKSIEFENPVSGFLNNMISSLGNGGNLSSTAKAVNYWLTHTKSYLPKKITEVSFGSYTEPISCEGDLPVSAFGKTLNLEEIEAQGVDWLICYGEKDNLVEPVVACAPADFFSPGRIKTTCFPGGHIKMATSFSAPKSQYPLDEVYSDGSVGPVRFHLDG